MVNSHFANDSHIFVNVDKDSLDKALSSLETFCKAFRAIVKPHKNDFCFIGVDESPTCILEAWSFIHLG